MPAFAKYIFRQKISGGRKLNVNSVCLELWIKFLFLPFEVIFCMYFVIEICVIIIRTNSKAISIWDD